MDQNQLNNFNNMEISEPIIQDSAFHNLPDHVLVKIFHKERWSIPRIILTCVRFHEVITNNRMLNNNFRFKVKYRALRQWTPVQAISNFLAILKTKRKFNDGDFHGIQSDSEWQVVASILEVIGPHIKDVDFTKCHGSKAVFAEILKLTPNVEEIVVTSIHISVNDFDEIDLPSLNHLKRLVLYNNESAASLFARARNVEVLSTNEQTLQGLTENIELSSLKHLTLSTSRIEEHPDRFRNVIPVALICRLQKLEVKGETELINLSSFLETQELEELKLECSSTDYKTMRLILRMKSLKKLTISLSNQEPINHEIFHIKNHSVEHLSIETPNYDEWNHSKVQMFVHLFPNLKSLTIGPHCAHIMDPKNFDFTSLKNLKDIDMELRKVWILQVEQPQITKLRIVSANTAVLIWKHFARKTPNVRHLEIVADNMLEVLEAVTITWKKIEVFNTPCLYPVPAPYKGTVLEAILRNCKNLKELMFMSLEGYKEEYAELLAEFDYKLSNLNYRIAYNDRYHEKYEQRLLEEQANIEEVDQDDENQ